MFEVKVISDFSSAHHLNGYQGKCESLHGHNWKVEVVVVGSKTDKIGMLMDFTEMKKALKEVLAALDHKNLNDISPFDKINPTSENIAKYIYEALKFKLVGIKCVSVWESENSVATYYGQ
jgi:6-pyruvoyltetrahydropterin/6-carboxytetrahydropterin synthase